MILHSNNATKQIPPTMIIASIIICNFIPSNSTVLPTYYYAESLSMILFTIFVLIVLIVKIKSKTRIIEYTISDIALSAFVLCILIIEFFNENTQGEQIPIILIFSCFYFLSSRNITHFMLSYVTIAIAIIQSSIGMYQYITTLNKISMVGTFSNQAGLAISIVISFPFIYYNINKTYNLSSKIYYFTILTFLTTILLLTGSRAGLLALFSSVIIFIIFSKSRVKILLTTISLVLLLSVFILSKKKGIY